MIKMNTELYKRIETAAHNMRENMLEMTLHAGASGAHIGGALSSADIVAVLYCGIMDRPGKQDHFVLSKGHCALVQYAALCETGVISREELMTFEDNGGMFPAHPVMHDEIGIELSSGAWGLAWDSASVWRWRIKRRRHRQRHLSCLATENATKAACGKPSCRRPSWVWTI